MSIRLALAGNPNCGKTTMFNELTGATQYVGNWPGVTVEKKEGKYKADKDLRIMDLPGIYSLSPYTLEEVVARDYLIYERPDVIVNLVDASNIERNLYLTTQLLEVGIPMVVALNMIDMARKHGDKIDVAQLSKTLGVPVVETTATKGHGVKEMMELAKKASGKNAPKGVVFGDLVEAALADISALVGDKVTAAQSRWFAIKLFERDEKVMERLQLAGDTMQKIESIIKSVEDQKDDDSASIITEERYEYIGRVVNKCVKKKRAALSTSDKVDRVVTNRILAIPIFIAVMWVVYGISMGNFGSFLTDWTNDGLFGDGFHLFGNGSEEYGEVAEGYEIEMAKLDAFLEAAEEEGVDTEGVTAVLEAEEDEAVDESAIDSFLADATVMSLSVDGEYENEDGDVTAFTVTATDFETALEAEEPDPADYGTWVPGIPVLIENFLVAINCADWLQSLIIDGIVAGVGAVLGFVPQMLVLFILLAILEECGYMARIAFIMDRIFRKFGLSGKSFIPMLIGSGCGVPAVMASRTIEQDRDRKMTIMTTCFVPCGAKMPIIAMFAGALFGGSSLIAVSAYFIGVLAIIISGIILKKTKMFAGDPAPFVMELPAYHMPRVGNVLRSMWERGWSFIKKAGTIILLSTIVIWFLSSYGFEDGSFGAVAMDASLLAAMGRVIAPLFAPLGFGDWRSTVGTVSGFIAKENVVATFGQLFAGLEEVAENGDEIWVTLQQFYTPIAAYSYMVFNLLCMPCFAAVGAIKREMNSAKWTWFAVGYMTVFAYTASLVIYQIGGLFTGDVPFGIGTIAAILVIAAYIYLLFRKPYTAKTSKDLKKMSVQQ